MSNYNWDIEYCTRLTMSQMFLFIEKINKREKNKNDFLVALHGGKPENKGLNTAGAVPIEDVIDSGKSL